MLYHLDRTGSLLEGARLELVSSASDDLLCAEGAGAAVARMFPRVISRHGLRYLSTVRSRVSDIPLFNLGSLEGDPSSAIIEQTFELVRRADFPGMPSRFQSVFCVEDPSELDAWPEITASGGALFEIAPADPARIAKLDASLLKGGFAEVIEPGAVEACFSFPLCAAFAYRYWSGEMSESPKPEVLVELPATAALKVRAIPPTPVPASETLQPHRWQ